MGKRKPDKGTRVIMATAGVVLGLVVGFVVVALLTGGGGGDAEPERYQPFFVGTSDRVMERINDGGPECYQDPRKGDRSFCLDVAGGQFVAYHVVPPGGSAACLVRWDRDEKRYEDCGGAPVDRATLTRFPVLTREINDRISVFVDLRTTTPAPDPPATTAR